MRKLEHVHVFEKMAFDGMGVNPSKKMVLLSQGKDLHLSGYRLRVGKVNLVKLLVGAHFTTVHKMYSA